MQFVHLARHRDHDGGAGAREAKRHGAAQSPAAAGDDRNLSFDRHVAPPLPDRGRIIAAESNPFDRSRADLIVLAGRERRMQ